MKLNVQIVVAVLIERFVKSNYFNVSDTMDLFENKKHDLTIGELKQMINEIPDDKEVIIEYGLVTSDENKECSIHQNLKEVIADDKSVYLKGYVDLEFWE